MMGEYFKPWRRKAGCVTLLISSALAAGWIRSFSIRDTIDFPRWNRKQTICGFVSENQSIKCQFVHPGGSFSPDLDEWFRWSSDYRALVKERTAEYVEEQSFCGIGRKYEEDDYGYSTYFRTQYFVPYWAIAIPASVLSAVLLLRPLRDKIKLLSDHATKVPDD